MAAVVGGRGRRCVEDGGTTATQSMLMYENGECARTHYHFYKRLMNNV